MDIGVPVFAALDGRVISVQDGEFDRNHGRIAARFDNHVVLEHAIGRFTIYGHLRKGIRLKRNDRVVAGQQLGWTASSGNSSWPHLHFTSQIASQIHEPFSGSCNEGPSGWTDQVATPSEAYVRDLALSAKPMTGKRDLPYDRAVRAGTFVRGTKVVYSRVELGALHATGVLRIRFHRPNGSSAAESTMTIRTAHGRGTWSAANRVSLARIGRWRIVVELDGKTLSDTTFDVVAAAAEVQQPPAARDLRRVAAAEPDRQGRRRVRCLDVLVAEDPDYDIVRYRYRWFVGGKLVRAVQSAALSDVLRKGLARPGKSVRCAVTPSDGRLTGPTATATSG